MSDVDDDCFDADKSNQFLASMSSLEGGKRRFLHGTDASQVLDKPLSEITGSKLTVESLLFDIDGDGGNAETDGKRKKKKKKKLKDLKTKDESKIEGDVEKIYKKTVEKTKEKLSLPAPLTTPQAQKAGRTAVYKKVGGEVAQWDAVIHSRRAAEVVTFPLEKPDMKLKSVAQHSQGTFTPRTPLEAEVMAALHGGRTDEETEPQKLRAGLTLKEQWHQMQEMARLKAHMRYQEAKIARQNKIKSKSYRRHLRKQKAKEKAKELEELQKSNPELAAEQMKDLEMDRTLERASLKHSKANKNRKLAFMQQADKRSGLKTTNLSSKAIHDSMNQKRRELMSKNATGDEDNDVESASDDDIVLNGDEKKSAFNFDVLLTEEKNPWIGENPNNDDNDTEMKERMAKLLKGMEEKSEKKAKAEVDPTDFGFVKEKNLLKVGNDDVNDDENEDEDEDGASGDEEKRQQIGEIFAEDDLIAEEFEAEKLAARRRQQKKKVEVALPGWGCWSGEAPKGRGKKRRRPLDKVKVGVKIPKVQPSNKKDQCTPSEHVIIADDKTALRPKQTTVVPFPFTSVVDYEASLRLPLGDTFIPRTSHKKVTQPKQKIPMGTIIEPMDKEVLVKRGILPAKTLEMIN